MLCVHIKKYWYIYKINSSPQNSFTHHHVIQNLYDFFWSFFWSVEKNEIFCRTLVTNQHWTPLTSIVISSKQWKSGLEWHWVNDKRVLILGCTISLILQIILQYQGDNIAYMESNYLQKHTRTHTNRVYIQYKL